ncbi:hypothetical protein M5K25_003053 [Dendrobium thyrsiflorum]|uniref:SANTA domain-containing protein n=1 Tax=Dendrobium thyrsiflorum TaxID=117978 RepID=A0ABD0VVC6_DENTH
MRIFDSSPIIKRHDAYTLETADGVTIRIEGFINKKRTLDNGFPFEACKTFLIGFPTTWTDYANDSSMDKASHAEIPLIASRGAECCKDSLENVPFGFPVKSKNIIPDNVSSTSNTSACASNTRLREAIQNFVTRVSTFSPVHMPFVDRSSHHLPERSICDNNQLQNDESCGANLRDAHTNNRFQDDETHGTNLRDAPTGYNCCETGHTPVDNASENREASCTEGLHTEGAGCPTVDLHLEGLPQEKCNGHVVTTVHHDEGVGTCSTSNLLDSVAGKGHQKKEIAQNKDEKFDECSTRRPKKVRPGSSNVENLHGEDQKYVKFTSKPVRRSLRLMQSNNLEHVNGEFQHSPQFLKETNDMNCANLILDRSKTCTSQPIATLAKGGSSSPDHYVEAQKCAKSFSKPVRRSERLLLLKLGNVHGEFQDYSQFLNETNNRFQDDETHGTNLRDAPTGYNYCETGHTPVDNASENRKASCTEGLHTEGAGCPTVDLHLEGLPQEKCNGHVVTTVHHDEGVGTCSTSNLLDSAAGKGHQKKEIAQNKDEKFDECSTRRPKKVRPGSSNVENLHGEDQKYVKFTSKHVRRSLRLMQSNNLEHAHGEFQDSPQFLKETNDMNCANLILDRSKTCTSQPIATLAKGGSSSPDHYVEGQKCAKSFSKPVRRSERLLLLKLGNAHGEFQDYSQFVNETNNQFQDDETHGTNLRDAPTGYNYCETGHTTVDNASENREASCTEGLHTDGAGCPTVDLHLEGLPQEKCNGHVVTTVHHDEGVGTCSTSNLLDSAAGKGHQKKEIAQNKDEKFDECSTRRPKKVRPGSSNVENLHGEDQKYVKFTSKPVRRSLRLMQSNNLEHVHVEFQDSPQFLKETNDMNCANLILDRSKTCTSQPIATLAKGGSSSPDHYVEARVLSEENQDGHKCSFNTRLGLVEETPANSKAVTSQTMGKKMLRRTGRKKDNQTARSRTKAEQNGSRNQSSGTSFEENILVSSASLSRRKAIPLTPISDKSSTMRKNSEVPKHIDASTETQQTKDKASHTIEYKTVWVSSYKDGHRTPLTRYKKNESSILTPESLNFKRSRSGRLLIPWLEDCSMRVIYEPDGSFAGTAKVDGSCAGNATVVMSTSQCKGSRKALNRKKRKKQR